MPNYPDLTGFQMPNFNGLTPSFDYGTAMQNSYSGLSPTGSTPTMAAPGGGMGGMPSMNNMGGAQGFGFNMPTAQFAMSGLQTLGSLWSAFQANKLAKKSFAFQKDFAKTNLVNSTQSYNTQMRDRIDSRAFVQGMSPEQANAYYETNSLRLPSNMRRKAG